MPATSLPPVPAANPRISIVVPTRDRPQLLRAALLGIREQSFAAYEVIIIDDGSSTQTREGYEALWQELDVRFRLVQLGHPGQKGIGPAAVRNHGLSLAQGELLAFCDDDDFWCDADHLARAVQHFDTDPALGIYIADQRACESSGAEKMACWLPGLRAQLAGSTPEGSRVSVAQLVRAGGFAHLNILILRRALAVEIGGFWERTVYEEDRDFFWRAVDRADAVFYCPQIIAQHNIPDARLRNNITTQQSMPEKWLLSVLVSQHIAITARQPAIRALVRGYEGDILRRLAGHFAAQGQAVLARGFAWRALAARFSFKWLAYSCLLSLRAGRDSAS